MTNITYFEIILQLLSFLSSIKTKRTEFNESEINFNNPYYGSIVMKL